MSWTLRKRYVTLASVALLWVIGQSATASMSISPRTERGSGTAGRRSAAPTIGVRRMGRASTCTTESRLCIEAFTCS